MNDPEKLPMNKYTDKGLPLDYFLKHSDWSGGTQYERDNKIEQTGNTLIIDEPDLKIQLQQKSDNSQTIVIYFRIGKNIDSWLRWTMLQSQADIMTKHFPKIYERVNIENEERRQV